MKNLIHKLFKNEDDFNTADLPTQETTPMVESCLHKWELVAKTYAAPAKVETTNTTDPRIIFGVTTCIWHCTNCGGTYRDEILGTDENRWLDIVDKVEKFGMQYIKVGDKVFGVAEWVPSLEDTNGKHTA